MSRPSAFHWSFTCYAAAFALFCPDQWTACSEVACVAFTCRFFDFMWGGAALIDEGIGEACDPGDASDSFDVDFLIFAVRAFGDDVAEGEAPGDDNAALICASFRCLSFFSVRSRRARAASSASADSAPVAGEDPTRAKMLVSLASCSRAMSASTASEFPPQLCSPPRS